MTPGRGGAAVADEGSARIERRANRIERWLRRCVAACRCGSWSSALMEIECMEAEAKGLRDDLWAAAEAEASGRKARNGRGRAFFVMRVALITAIFVVSLSIPLSVDQDRPLGAFDMGTIELLSRSESELISALRQRLSEANEGRSVITVEVRPAPEPEAAPRGAASAAERRPVRRVRVARADEQKPTETTEARRSPSIEEVLSLMQIGERALRMPETAVKVIP